MNLVDSCGWLEFFADGKNADFYSRPLEDLEHLLVPTICLLEVFKKVLQEKDENSAFQAAAIMQQAKIVNLDAALALSAAKISVQVNLPPADSIILAAAHQYNAVIWTQDEHFQGIRGVRYIPKKP